MAKVLVVEDDVSLGKMVRDWLALEHHQTEVVTDGAEAKEMLKVYKFDVIVLDWELPNLSGIEILKDFRSRGGLTPVLILTGKGSIIEKEAGCELFAVEGLGQVIIGTCVKERFCAARRVTPEIFLKPACCNLTVPTTVSPGGMKRSNSCLKSLPCWNFSCAIKIVSLPRRLSSIGFGSRNRRPL